MKIVIDIDNESYEHIKSFKNEDVLPIGWYAISHGTPLTKVDCVSRAELKKWLDMNFSFGGALRKLELFDRLDKELPSVTPTQEPILDEIRAEIESCREDEEPHLVDYRYCRNEGLDMALDIIDKYKAESEK